MHAGGDHRTQSLDGLDLLDAGGLQAIETPECLRQLVGDRCTDVGYPQTEQKPTERPLPRHVNGIAEVLHRRLAESLKPGDPVEVEGVDVGHVGHQALGHEQVHPCLAEAVNVHCSTGGKVLDTATNLTGARVVNAERGCLALRADQQGSTHRTQGRELPRNRSRRAFRENRSKHLGNHITGLADDDHVSGADIFHANLIGVVKGRRRNRGPTHEHRLKACKRRRLPTRSDGHLDVKQTGGALLWWQLVGDRPPGSPGRAAQLLLDGKVIDLDHNPVDLVVEVVAGGLDSQHVGYHVVKVGQPHGPVVHRQAEVAEPQERLVMTGGLLSTTVTGNLTDLIGPEREVAGVRYRRILLPQGTRRSVARVHERLFPARLTDTVQLRKRRF